MKILLINSVCGIRSTGRICTDIADVLKENGHECLIAYGRENVPERFQRFAIRIGDNTSVRLNAIKARLLDNEGLNAVGATKAFLRWAEEYNPDMLWLHNIHGYYINYPLLFQWIKSRPEMQVQWTLHDCWAFTGHCTYFTMCGCNQWKSSCDDCPQKREYPASIVLNRAKQNYKMKREAFSGIQNMKLITPSKWLADLTRESYMNQYPVEVVYNTVDKAVFKPVVTDYKVTHGIKGKMVLGVAAVWDKRKGLEDFIRLANLRKDITVVLVGVSKKQIAELPKGIIGIMGTNNPHELAELYSAADVFFLPTREDNYPTVCLEAEACGTRVVTYDVGGCKETIFREDSVAVSGFEEALKVI